MSTQDDIAPDQGKVSSLRTAETDALPQLRIHRALNEIHDDPCVQPEEAALTMAAHLGEGTRRVGYLCGHCGHLVSNAEVRPPWCPSCHDLLDPGTGMTLLIAFPPVGG